VVVTPTLTLTNIFPVSISHLIDQVDIASSSGTHSHLRYDDSIPDELRDCVKEVPKPSKHDLTRRNQQRQRTKRFLLTYSKINEDEIHHTAVVEKVHNLGGRIRIASEHHQDGTPHWHAYVAFEKSQNSRDMKRFDVGNHHCHIRYVIRTPVKAWEYCVKNVGKGDNTGILLYDDFPNPPEGRIKKKGKKGDGIIDMYDQATKAGTREQALSIIKDERPDHYWKSCFSIEHAASRLFPTTADTTYSGPNLEELGVDWTKWPELDDWINKYLPSVFNQGKPEEQRILGGGPPPLTPDNSSIASGSSSLFGGEDESMGGFDILNEGTWTESPPQAYVTPTSEAQQKLSAPQHRPRPKVLILWGPTRTGKSLLARALGRHMYHSGKFNINVCTSDVDYAVFDDLKDGFNSPNFDYKAWMGGQNEFTIEGKWMRETKFVWNSKPCIYICNRDPLEDKEGVIKGIDYDWITANAVSVHVATPLHRMAQDQM
jgi:hypothetical protein